MSRSATGKSSALRNLPAVDQLLKLQSIDQRPFGAERIKAFARQTVNELRSEIQKRLARGEIVNTSAEDLLDEAARRMEALFAAESKAGLRRVINATGVILHTNLGRAPLSEAACAAVQEAAGYCTLEYDTSTGTRGRRGAHVEELLKQLTGAEDALVVNNCASAALLVLTTLAHEGETVVSRGELVEIGGDFRVPDVLANSGTRMIEVGTTNRTKLDDYRRALNDHTRLVLRIHPSNYRIVGFTSSPTLSELASLAHEHGLPLYEDAGSGALQDLSAIGLSDEPVIRESIAAGAEVVSFSGDKLLGASQAGILVGRHEIIERLRRHSLYRALRTDKLCLAALEATLEAHARGTATSEIPTLRMLSTSADELAGRAKNLVGQISTSSLNATLVAGESAIGGGSGPNTHPPTTLIALTHPKLSASEIEAHLRNSSPPVIARIAEGQVLLDLRTVEPAAEAELLRALSAL